MSTCVCTKSEKEIEDGFTAYYKGKAEADEKFAKADAEFKDARIELADAEKNCKSRGCQRFIDDIDKVCAEIVHHAVGVPDDNREDVTA